jgi:hypothetical protein
MEARFIKALVALGVPGVALGIFYLLLKAFNFQFSQIGAEATALIAILFLLVVGFVTVRALDLWAPTRQNSSEQVGNPAVMVLDVGKGEERVTLTELLRSVTHDVVRVGAHTHQLGVAAEYRWKDRTYPGSTWMGQSIAEFKLQGSDGKPRKVYFDVLRIRLLDGREKQIYFDISSFFGGGVTSSIDPDAYITQKIKELYK